VKRFWEWYFDLNAAPAGEGTEWRWVWRWPWPADWPPWVVLLAALAVLAYVVWVYRRDAAAIPLRRRVGLTALRLGGLLVTAAMLTEISLVVIRTGLPSCVILIDTSASMTLPGRPASTTGTATPGPDRLSLVQEILSRNNGEFLEQLLKNFQLRLYQFSESAAPLEQSDVTDRDQLQRALAEIRALKAEGKQTRPAPSLRKVLADLRGQAPSAVVVFTDGAASLAEGDQLSHGAKTARQQGVQIYAVGVGSDEVLKDVQLDDLVVDEIAFVGDPLLFAARLRTFGYAGESLTVQLRDVNQPRVLASQKVTAGSDGQPVKLELMYAPESAGEFDYRLEAVLDPRETNPENNSQTRHVSVREEKIRVLLVDFAPRYEFRYLKQLLERDKSIELRTLLQEADLEFAQEDKTAVSHFPVRRDELAEIDVFILGDISAASVPEAAWKEIADRVRTAGAGVIFIAGMRQDLTEFSGSAFEPLLPFDVRDVKPVAPHASIREGFHPVLTLEGRKGSHLFRMADSEAESLRVWSQLPEWYWFREIPVVKPGVVVFAEHPTRTGSKGNLPLILVQRIGAGKVLFHATDETWRWRFRSGDAYFGRYWIQAIRYLSRSRLVGKDRAAELTTDRLVYEQGEPILLRARYQEDRFLPPPGEPVIVTMERQGGRRQTVSLAAAPQLPMIFEGQVTNLPDGEYHAWITSPAAESAPATADFRIEAPVRELQQRALNRSDLEQACRISNGRYYAWNEAGRLPSELPPGPPIRLESDQPIPLWNRSELLCLLAGLLTAEWWFRKRCRLV
jgi:hypothetical protein